MLTEKEHIAHWIAIIMLFYSFFELPILIVGDLFTQISFFFFMPLFFAIFSRSLRSSY